MVYLNLYAVVYQELPKYDTGTFCRVPVVVVK